MRVRYSHMPTRADALIEADRRRGRRRGRRPVHGADGGARGGARCARVRLAARPIRQLLGAGRPGRGARPDDSPARTWRTRSRAGRGAARTARRARCSARRRPGACSSSSGAASHSTADATARWRSALEGGHSRRRVAHAGGSATGRRVTAALSALRRGTRAIEVHRAQLRRCGCGWTTGAASGSSTDGGPMPAAADRARHRRRGRAVAAHDQPAGRDRRRPAARAPGRRRARRSRAHAVPPHRAGRRADGMDGFLVTEAVRGEGAPPAEAAGERFVDELAPRDEVARAIHEQLAEAASRRAARHAGRATERFPNIVETLAACRARPATRPVPGRPRRALHDRGHRHRPRRALHAGGPVRRRRVCLHRPARREPAGLQLASECFVFGRRAALAAGARTIAAAARTSPCEGRPAGRALGGDPRSALGACRARARAAGLAAAGRRPASAGAPDRPRGAARAEESRGCHIRSDFPATDAALDERHFVLSGGARRIASERWP